VPAGAGVFDRGLADVFRPQPAASVEDQPGQPQFLGFRQEQRAALTKCGHCPIGDRFVQHHRLLGHAGRSVVERL
jgi:hypothetical protein